MSWKKLRRRALEIYHQLKEELKEEKEATIEEIQKITGYSKPFLYKILKIMEDLRMVVKRGQKYLIK